MLKLKHKLISSLIVAAPLLLNTGAVTTVHASSANDKSCAANTACKSTESNNCTTINGVKYDCSKLIQSICSGVNDSVYNCIK